jgi:hypothetical protein
MSHIAPLFPIPTGWVVAWRAGGRGLRLTGPVGGADPRAWNGGGRAGVVGAGQLPPRRVVLMTAVVGGRTYPAATWGEHRRVPGGQTAGMLRRRCGLAEGMIR